MAYKKTVQGRSYLHLYNVTITVGSRKAFSQTTIGSSYPSSYTLFT